MYVNIGTGLYIRTLAQYTVVFKLAAPRAVVYQKKYDKNTVGHVNDR